MLKRFAQVLSGAVLLATAVAVLTIGPLTSKPAAALLPMPSLAPLALLLAAVR